MSDTVHFGCEIGTFARAATVETIIAYLRKHAPDHSEFSKLVAREKEFERIGGWFFDDLSVEALKLLRRLTDQLAADPEAAAHWTPERRPVFYADLDRFRQKLAERLSFEH